MSPSCRPFGSTGFEVSALGQGTWNMERDDRRGAIAALRAGLDAGATHVDTAEMYGEGRVEELVGEAISGRRDEVFLVSKVLPENASRRGTVAACERSLRRLRTDRLDGYLLHWAGEHPLADTIAAFEELAAAGKIRCYGVSNFDEDELAGAVRLAGAGRIACNQVLHHLGERRIEHAVIPLWGFLPSTRHGMDRTLLSRTWRNSPLKLLCSHRVGEQVRTRLEVVVDGLAAHAGLGSDVGDPGLARAVA